MKITSDDIHPCVGVCVGAMRQLNNERMIGLLFPKEGMECIRFLPLESANALVGMLSEAIEEIYLHKAGCGLLGDKTLLRRSTDVRWKSAEEELPSNDATVLVAWATSKNAPVGTAYYDPISGWRTLDHFPLPSGSVSYWSDLPRVPEEMSPPI